MRREYLVGGNKNGYPVVSWLVLFLNVLWFSVIERQNGFSSGGLLKSGAVSLQTLEQGQLFRLVSFMFVHMSVWHIVGNMLFLLALSFLELLIGRVSYLFLYFTAGVLSGLSVFLIPIVYTAGSSGAIYGLFGLAFIFSLKGEFGNTLKYQIWFWFFVNVEYDVVYYHHLNWVAHVIGFFVGICWGLYALRVHSYQERKFVTEYKPEFIPRTPLEMTPKTALVLRGFIIFMKVLMFVLAGGFLLLACATVVSSDKSTVLPYSVIYLAMEVIIVLMFGLIDPAILSNSRQRSRYTYFWRMYSVLLSLVVFLQVLN